MNDEQVQRIGRIIRAAWLINLKTDVDELDGITIHTGARDVKDSRPTGITPEIALIMVAAAAEGCDIVPADIAEITQKIGTETGCMCLVKGGLGYATDPTWSQGFASAEAI